MQTLYFENAWERTIAQDDRDYIIEKFEEVKLELEEGIHFTFLWAAENHKKDLLITALIHNVRSYPLLLDDTVIAYQTNTDTPYINKFYIKETIPAHSTMPWTFIFSENKPTYETPKYVIVAQ